tara:strand:+ start:343 stop:789 length:447 start_codon:yes stop_codon:yes gene_type:complete
MGSKTQKRRTSNNKTLRRGGASKKQKAKIVETFLAILNAVKLYHWKTKSYAQHQATDQLHAKLSEDIDKFVEILIAKSRKRIDMFTKTLRLYDFNNKRQLKTKMFEFREFLLDLDRVFDSKKDSDIFNIRDDMITEVNQFLYLLTLDK